MKHSNTITKRILALVLVLCLALPLLVACGSSAPDAPDASGTIENTSVSWSYKKESKTLTVTGAGAIPDFAVNEDSDTPWAEARLSAEKIEISEGITAIGAYAFWGMNNVTSVIVPYTVTEIRPFAFAYCGKLTSFAFPTGLVSIGNSAFEGCGALESVFLYEATATIGDYAFAYCSAMKSALITASPAEGATLIGAHAFENCRSLSNLVLRTSVTAANIGEDAFKNASKSLESATMTDNADGSSVYTVHVVVDGVETRTYTETRAYGESKDIIPEGMEGYTVSPPSAKAPGNGANGDVTFTYTKIEAAAPAETDSEANEGDNTEDPEKSNVKAIIAIVVMAVLIIGLVVGAILLFRSDKKNGQKKGTPKNQKK